MKSPEDFVKGIIKLISLPEIFIRVKEVMEDPDHDAKQLADVISHDPSLTVRILRIVNSAYYGLSVKVELVSRAVSVIGEEDLRNLILATSAVDAFKHINNELVDIDLFWKHSVHTGIISRLLSKHCNILHSERLFIAGLLHDIGKLVLYHKEPDISQRVLLHAAETDGLLYHAEQQIIGFTHAEIGGALIKNWKLADTLIDVISHHHTPLKAQKHPIETAIVHIADHIVNAIEPGVMIDETRLRQNTDFEAKTLQITGLDLTTLPQIMDQAWAQAGEILDIICPRSY